MSLSKKSMVGGLVGAIIGVALIIGGALAYSTGSLGGLFGGNSGTLQLSIIDPPDAPANVTHVTITYTSMQVHVANGGNNSGWHNITSSGQIDLMSVVNQKQVLGSANLPAGTYNIIRFNMTSATVTVHSISGDKIFSVQIANGRMQVTITGGGVHVKSGATSYVLVDITPKVNYDANNGYTIVPAASATTTSS
jgi:hypothetical protein